MGTTNREGYKCGCPFNSNPILTIAHTLGSSLADLNAAMERRSSPSVSNFRSLCAASVIYDLWFPLSSRMHAQLYCWLRSRGVIDFSTSGLQQNGFHLSCAQGGCSRLKWWRIWIQHGSHRCRGIGVLCLPSLAYAYMMSLLAVMAKTL